MRHRVAGKKLDRDTNHRKSLRVNLMKSLLMHERITTTRAKAQFIEGHVEKLITIAKRANATGDEARGVHARRVVAAKLYNDKDLTKKVFDTLAPRYAERPGGYTRMLRLGQRAGDAADMVIVELVDRPAASE
ncbi:MAG: 50S ribosomal protein L17 [Anaerolineae bacterium]